MRRLAIISILMFSLIFQLAAVSYDSQTQVVSGFIGKWVECTIEDIHSTMNSNRGINLNINDQNNNHRYLIAPTQVELTKPGLMIGRFSINASTSKIKLTVTPGLLVNSSDSSITYEYELAVSYILESNTTQTTHTQICKSGNSMVLDFDNPSGVVIANDAGIYFRLRSEVTDNGDYTSNVVFLLEDTE